MTPEELYERMRKELEETWELYRQGVDVLLEKIKNTTESAPAGGRLYTAFDVIRLVQEATSNEIYGLGAEEASVAFEVERSIIQKLAKEENA